MSGQNECLVRRGFREATEQYVDSLPPLPRALFQLEHTNPTNIPYPRSAVAMNEMATPLRLLLVEDSERDAAVLVEMLQQGGYAVVAARVETAEAMTAMFDHQCWDLVIAEYRLPSFSAVAALAVLRDLHVDPPLIIVSGTSNEEAVVECMKQGAADYLLKVRLGRLGESVRRALDERALRAGERLAEQQLRFHALLPKAVEQALFATDREGTTTYWNQAAERLFGWPAAAMLGRSILDLTPAHPSQVQAAAIMAGLRSGERWSGEYLAQRRDGSTFPALVTSSPLRNECGALIGAVAVCSDGTERLRVQEEAKRVQSEAKELARLRSDFVEAVNHELRTPLTAIIGFSELLQTQWQRISEPKRREYLARIATAARREHRQVADLLMSSTLETGTLVTDCQPVPLAFLVQQATTEIHNRYPRQRIDLEGPTHQRVLVDADRILQVLVNLLDNAARYSPEGSAVTVSWTCENGVVLVRVCDHGPGIPEQGRQYLFTRFGRMPGSPIRNGRVGSGLGLYISRSLVEAMGGVLDLEATGPEGSTFRLRLRAYPRAHQMQIA